jgi:hypothetical protein
MAVCCALLLDRRDSGRPVDVLVLDLNGQWTRDHTRTAKKLRHPSYCSSVSADFVADPGG